MAVGADRDDPRMHELTDRIAALFDGRNGVARATADFSQLVACEMELVRLLPKEMKIRACWNIRERFERVASARSVDQYRASKPPSLANPDRLSDEAMTLVEADAITLLGQINRIFLMNREGERTINDLQRWVGWTIVRDISIFLVFVAITYVLIKALFGRGSDMSSVHFSKIFLVGLIMIMFMGYLGAAMSTIRRLQAAVGEGNRRPDPYFELAPLRFGRRGIRLGMISGSIFSLLLYFIFVSGAGEMLGVKGGIFPRPVDAEANQVLAAKLSFNLAAAPEGGVRADGQATPIAISRRPDKDKVEKGVEPEPIKDCYTAAGPSCGWFALLAGRMGFAEPGDFFKMLIWAFIAGFAERLVPDAIDRLVSRSAPGRPPPPEGSGNE
ncbi:hypothetical protein ACFB49_34210 [Sphingomonas sp. DBB INV C78]